MVGLLRLLVLALVLVLVILVLVLLFLRSVYDCDRRCRSCCGAQCQVIIITKYFEAYYTCIYVLELFFYPWGVVGLKSRGVSQVEKGAGTS